MAKIFNTEEIKELERYTIEHEPVTSIELVERAASAFAGEFCRRYAKQTFVYVFAGKGNNGADALAIARLLHEAGYELEVYLFNPKNDLSPECEAEKTQLLAENEIRIFEIVNDFTPPRISSNDVVIDGLFGTGLKEPLKGGFAAVVDYINQSGASIVAIDIPSGLFCDNNSGNDPEHIIRANRTCSFEFPKLSFMFAENEPFVGKWTVHPIGLHPEAVEHTSTPYRFITDYDMKGLIRSRPTFAHKGMFGHALLIAGGKCKMGAAVLAAGACLRSGAGRLTVHIPQRGETILQTAVPEAMINLDIDPDHFSILPDIAGCDAIGIGPGIGVNGATADALEALLATAAQPLVLDADALNLLAADTQCIDQLPPQTILTPHPREFDRMFGECANGYQRLQKAIDMATKYTLFIVLKGAYTAVCTPDGKVLFNSTGNPGMATAGSGDVLTGVILGLLAQGYPPETAAVAGVYIHGLAGDIAAATIGHESLVAGDIVRQLCKAFKMQDE